MIYTIILTIVYVLTPVLLIYLSERFVIFNKIGAVLLAYALGLIIGNIKRGEGIITAAEIECVHPLCFPIMGKSAKKPRSAASLKRPEIRKIPSRIIKNP